MGYKSPLRGGKYRKCNDSFIRDIVGDCKTDLANFILIKTYGKIDVELYKAILRITIYLL